MDFLLTTYSGKGRGLVAVLHGPPGTGKTLTAEGIAELLKRPLYMVSTGELGTRPDQLETELNKILDVAHSWGAVLLLDEADVFLGMFRNERHLRTALMYNSRGSPTPRRRQKRTRQHIPPTPGILPRYTLLDYQPRRNIRSCLSIPHSRCSPLRRTYHQGQEQRMENLPRQGQGYWWRR